MTLDQLQTRLHALHAKTGFDGRLSLSVEAERGEPCSLTHWYRPARYAPMMHRTVGVGSPADCLAALERYVARLQAERAAPAPEYAIAAE